MVKDLEKHTTKGLCKNGGLEINYAMKYRQPTISINICAMHVSLCQCLTFSHNKNNKSLLTAKILKKCIKPYIY